MTIRVKRDEGFFKRVAENIQRESVAALRLSTGIVQGRVRKEITRQKIVDTGHLRNSFQQGFFVNGGKMFGVVGSNSIYALPLEEGITKRFSPSPDMIDSLIAWAKRKLRLKGKAAEKAGTAIAWKIGKKGLDPDRFPARYAEIAFAEAAPQVVSIITRHIERAIKISKQPPKVTR